MATYGNMVITDAGQTLYSKVQAGATLEFTRMQIGSGQLATSATLSGALTSGTVYTSLTVNALTEEIASGSTIVIGTGGTTQTVTTSSPASAGATTISVNSFTANAAYASGTTLAITENFASLTALVSPIGYFSIGSVSDSSVTAYVRGVYQNTSLTASTYTCEIGLFAQDPDVGEILYAYANAGANGDTIPPYSDGPYSRQFQINTAIGNATSITATVPANTYVPESDVGAASGVAPLDANKKVPMENLPADTAATEGTVVERDSNGASASTAFSASGLTGAVTPSRYVGATAGGAPTAGTFETADWCIDATNATVWICTVAGTPGTWAKTSSIIASGTNSNGSYIQFSDGTQICWMEWQENPAITIQSGSMYYQNLSTLNYPSAFVGGSTPFISLQPFTSSVVSIVPRSNTNLAYQGRVWSPISQTITGMLYLMTAIGRWK